MRIILLGPTGVGKTKLSLDIAESLNTSVISADSRQCYKYTDIGTAKPTEQELKRIPHYNISELEPVEEDSAMEFQRRATVWEKEILKTADHVLYVGGSTLHIQSLIQPFNEMPQADEENLEQLKNRMEEEGIESLYAILQEVDPEYAEKMDGMNTQRIIRALDVWMQTGNAFSSYHQKGDLRPDSDTLVFGLRRPRKELYDRINQRVDEMMQKGLLDEVKHILDQGYSPELQSLNTVGYKELIKYLDGDWKLEKAIEKIKTSTRRYAKRQMTWFKRWEFIQWMDASKMSPDEMRSRVLEQLG